MSTDAMNGAVVFERLDHWKHVLVDQLRFLRRDRLAFVGVVIVAGFLFLGLFGPMLAPHDPIEHDMVNADGAIMRLASPSADAPFGTTAFGKDVFSQFLAGARPTLIVGLFGGLGTGIIGFLVGLVSGYYGGWVDEVLMRMTDLTFSLPFMPMALLLLTFVTPSIWLITLIIAGFLWKMPARVVRSEVLSVRERTFVKSARASGASDLRTMLLHVGPNVLPIGFLYTAYGVAWAIAAQASLAFLGFGDPTMTSWGRMLRQVFESGNMRIAWWWVFPPAIGIAAITTSVFLIGRAYEEVINPEIQTEQ
ncbi:ABC transporter permease [Haloferax mediterranei ATCC 33500]|uniref:ABC transporter permease n=2 Tax=Haloferacaceae TaxID=1644056 RepID=I3R5P4_HALMT|nr:ABC transporter permease [Haloferax mediterranei]AFK19554.1 oligopeptide transport system permease protein OppC [Haloferax mediterranei ATCC 33500]AHZ22946.1 peptide ABC transporter permease [Haloferax mediterranei ATCC 33500]ELZ99874.1 oligopeptide transport system permease OppC [Haloferax mediterranei ATCC 33500]MDX5987703.1 ABC transporter permease [Haloferax mediterranei ATCC 33500]QCQ74188.1 ABC transporter permease [Haloferax mediterranei ATCC 33500]